MDSIVLVFASGFGVCLDRFQKGPNRTKGKDKLIPNGNPPVPEVERLSDPIVGPKKDQ